MGAAVQLDGKEFEIIGIDDYVLQNSCNAKRDWISYTLLSQDRERAWISYGVADNFFTRWEEIDQSKYEQMAKTATVDLDLTGIAKITFTGDMGHSTPDAEMVWSRTNGGPEFLIIERFLTVTSEGVQPMETYFQTGTILENFSVD